MKLTLLLFTLWITALFCCAPLVLGQDSEGTNKSGEETVVEDSCTADKNTGCNHPGTKCLNDKCVCLDEAQGEMTTDPTKCTCKDKNEEFNAQHQCVAKCTANKNTECEHPGTTCLDGKCVCMNEVQGEMTTDPTKCTCKDKNQDFNPQNQCVDSCTANKNTECNHPGTKCLNGKCVCMDEAQGEITTDPTKCTCNDKNQDFDALHQCVEPCATKKEDSDWNDYCNNLNGTCRSTGKKAFCECPDDKEFENDKCIDYDPCKHGKAVLADGTTASATDFCRKAGSTGCISINKKTFKCGCNDVEFFDTIKQKCIRKSEVDLCVIIKCLDNQECKENKCVCKEGYKEKDNNCEVVKMCEIKPENICKKKVCTENKNNPIRPICSCPEGFEISGDTCKSIACTIPKVNKCQHKCIELDYFNETSPAFECQCHGGFTLKNKISCEIDAGKKCNKVCENGQCLSENDKEECICNMYFDKDDNTTLCTVNKVCESFKDLCPNCTISGAEATCDCTGKFEPGENGLCKKKTECNAEEKEKCRLANAICNWVSEDKPVCDTCLPGSEHHNKVCTKKCNIPKYSEKCTSKGATCKANGDEVTCDCPSNFLSWDAESKTCSFGYGYDLKIPGIKAVASPSSFYYAALDNEVYEEALGKSLKNVFGPDFRKVKVIKCDGTDTITCNTVVLLASKATSEQVSDMLKNPGCVDIPTTSEKKTCFIPPALEVVVEDLKNVEASEPKDPCQETVSPCGNYRQCVSGTRGSFTCECKGNFKSISAATNEPGYKHIICEDIDECEDGSNKCNKDSSTCLNTFGDYQCECKNHFLYDPKDKPNRKVCTGICDVDVNKCQNGGTCNPDGENFFKCNCPDGKTGLLCTDNIVTKVTKETVKEGGSDAIIVGCVLGAILLVVIVVAAVSISKLRKAKGLSNLPSNIPLSFQGSGGGYQS